MSFNKDYGAWTCDSLESDAPDSALRIPHFALKR
jgi:hypothetical protein